MGVNAFRTPVIPLAICVCAIANIKAGPRLPTSPTLASLAQCFGVILFSLFATNGSNTRPAEEIRSAPTSIGPKAIRPFLMSKKELPQISASKPKSNQA